MASDNYLTKLARVLAQLRLPPGTVTRRPIRRAG